MNDEQFERFMGEVVLIRKALESHATCPYLEEMNEYLGCIAESMNCKNGTLTETLDGIEDAILGK